MTRNLSIPNVPSAQWVKNKNTIKIVKYFFVFFLIVKRAQTLTRVQLSKSARPSGQTRPRVGFSLSRAWHRLYVFSRLAPVACFPALGTSYIFSRAWNRLRVFPGLAPVTCFPALGTSCMFSRAWHQLITLFDGTLTGR